MFALPLRCQYQHAELIRVCTSPPPPPRDCELLALLRTPPLMQRKLSDEQCPSARAPRLLVCSAPSCTAAGVWILSPLVLRAQVFPHFCYFVQV